jgi:hypothetical protein
LRKPRFIHRRRFLVEYTFLVGLDFAAKKNNNNNNNNKEIKYKMLSRRCLKVNISGQTVREDVKEELHKERKSEIKSE